MISDREVWRAAAAMVKRYGDSAEIEAAVRAGDHLAAGATQSQAVWLLICRAITALQKVTPNGPVH